VVGQGAQRAETGEEGATEGRFRDAAPEGHVYLAELQHLRGVDQPEVSRRAGGAHGVARAGHLQVEADLSGGVVGHRARVVVVRPEGVVPILRDSAQLLLRIRRAVLGDSQVHAESGRVHRIDLEPGVEQRFPGAVDRDAARPRAAAELLLLLMAQGIEVDVSRQRRPEELVLDALHARHAVEQVLAVLRQGVAVRAGESHARDHDAGQLNHDSPRGRGRCRYRDRRRNGGPWHPCDSNRSRRRLPRARAGLGRAPR